MVGTELAIRPATPRQRGHAGWLSTAIGTWVLALLVCLLLAATVSFAPGGHSLARALLGAGARIAPHPASGRTVVYALGLLLNNTIVALWPLTGLFVLRDFPSSLRRVFIGVVVLSGARSAAPLAAAIGLWGTRLLPYIPNAPFELAAITTGGVLYVLASGQRLSGRALRTGVTAVLVLLLIAAALETWAVPAH